MMTEIKKEKDEELKDMTIESSPAFTMRILVAKIIVKSDN
jgi:hypothetical protein